MLPKAGGSHGTPPRCWTDDSRKMTNLGRLPDALDVEFGVVRPEVDEWDVAVPHTCQRDDFLTQKYEWTRLLGVVLGEAASVRVLRVAGGLRVTRETWRLLVVLLVVLRRIASLLLTLVRRLLLVRLLVLVRLLLVVDVSAGRRVHRLGWRALIRRIVRLLLLLLLLLIVWIIGHGCESESDGCRARSADK